MLAVRDFPIGGGKTADLVLRHFDPIAPQATVQVGLGPPKPIDRAKLPRFFKGTISSGFVFVVAETSGVYGLVQRENLAFVIGPRPLSLSSYEYVVEPLKSRVGTGFEKHKVILQPPSAARSGPTLSASGLGAESSSSEPLEALVAFDVSEMIFEELGGVENVITYVGILLATHAARLYQEIPMNLQLGFIHIWDSGMPYDRNAEDYDVPFQEFINYWNEQFTLVPRDVGGCPSGC